MPRGASIKRQPVWYRLSPEVNNMKKRLLVGIALISVLLLSNGLAASATEYIILLQKP
jgi:hypothetical protein